MTEQGKQLLERVKSAIPARELEKIESWRCCSIQLDPIKVEVAPNRVLELIYMVQKDSNDNWLVGSDRAKYTLWFTVDSWNREEDHINYQKVKEGISRLDQVWNYIAGDICSREG